MNQLDLSGLDGCKVGFGSGSRPLVFFRKGLGHSPQLPVGLGALSPAGGLLGAFALFDSPGLSQFTVSANTKL